MREETFHKLRRFNLIMGGLHLLQGILMIFLATSVIQNIAEFMPKITQFYLTFNTQTMSLEQTSRALFDLPFGIFVAVFLLISAGAHALISIHANRENPTSPIHFAFRAKLGLALLSNLVSPSTTGIIVSPIKIEAMSLNNA
ncbi:MAG: hypothetical protein R6W96_04175, partial [Clostridia bacterium]